MNKIFIILLSFTFLAVTACSGGGSNNNDENNTETMDEVVEMMGEAMEEEMVDEEPMEEVDTRNGSFTSTELSMSLVVRDTVAPESTPAEGTCLGDLSVTVDTELLESIVGEGSCLTDANSATYSVTASFTSETEFSGEMTIVFNGRDHVIPFSGSIDGDTITVTFMGTTDATARIVIDWDGSATLTRVVE